MSGAERPIFRDGLIPRPQSRIVIRSQIPTPVSAGIIEYYNMDKRKLDEDFGVERGFPHKKEPVPQKGGFFPWTIGR